MQQNRNIIKRISVFEKRILSDSQFSINLQFAQQIKQNSVTLGSHVIIDKSDIITGRATPVPKPIPTNNSLQFFLIIKSVRFECTTIR